MKLLLKNPNVLLSGEEGFYITQSDVYISGDCIVAVGFEPVNFVADKVIDCTDKLVMPGLVNAHTHGYMSLLRNMANDLPLDKWLFDCVFPREDMMTAEDCYWGTMLAIIEMIKTGTTCFNDMYLKFDSVIKAVTDCGIRAMLGRGVADSPGAEYGRQGLTSALEHIEKMQGNDLIVPALAPHAVYTCSESFLRQIAGIAQETGIPMHIHLSETAKEVADCQAAHEGLTPIAYAESIGLLDGHTIVAHGVKATQEDIDILKNTGAYLVTNPMSNMKLGSGIAPVPLMLQAGVKVSLGTDGAASNNTLNMFREMAAEAQIYKGIYEDSTVMPAQKVLKMATEDGAEALGMGDYIGKIKEGYKADLIILNLSNPEFMPLNGVLSSLVYSSYGSEVETVIINGEVVMEDRRFVMIDEQQIYSEVAWRAQKLKECVQ